ncbi:MAG: PucR family transcriptional regulator ligand-binding domain-containing protein [Alicyclobacillaceae bacterium]|nr:PucR family transcriptional regulator ligand-binding domain-containing protein [Alicyclobacillaceae bacterium]
MTIGDPFTIEDVLNRPIFREAKVVAGHEGLRRPVRWVHVLEVTDAAGLLHGQELILTTGVGLGRDEQTVFHYVRELVERGVSGLCIELGRYFPAVPEPVKEFADRHHFPVIIFERPVRFIDITQDIHAHLIDRHHHQLVHLERISRQFLQLTLRPQGIRRILELLYRETGCMVRLQDEVGEVIAYPDSFDALGTEKTDHIIRQPIVAMDTQVGELIVAVSGDPSEYLQLVLDRAATAIAQELLRRMSLEERRLRTTQRWMDDLLHRGDTELPSSVAPHIRSGGAIMVAAVRPVFRGNNTGATETEGRSAGPEPSEDALLLHVARTLPAAFEVHGLTGWLAPQGDRWAVVAVDGRPSSNTSAVERMKEALNELFRRLSNSRFGNGWSWTVGLGRKVNHWSRIPKAWRQAVQALSVQQPPGAPLGRISALPPVTFISYDDLHIWQLFLEVNADALRQFVEDQIGTLLAHDRQHGTELVETLRVFLASSQSKQQAAKSLFIHRQTLYYRLEQITALLGEDWETPPRRLALETALAAHQFLEAGYSRTD